MDMLVGLNENGEPSSNSDLTCCAHFLIKAPVKARNLSLPSLNQAMIKIAN